MKRYEPTIRADGDEPMYEISNGRYVYALDCEKAITEAFEDGNRCVGNVSYEACKEYAKMKMENKKQIKRFNYVYGKGMERRIDGDYVIWDDIKHLIKNESD